MKAQEYQEQIAKLALVWMLLLGVWGLHANAEEVIWEQTNGPCGGTILSLLAIPDGTLYAGTVGGGVFCSGDAGNSWTPAGLTNHNVLSLAVLGTTLYAGTAGGGIFRAKDGGNSWTQVNTGLTDRRVRSLAVLGTTLYAGTVRDGVFRLEDTSDYWAQVNTGLINRRIQSFVVLGTTLYA